MAAERDANFFLFPETEMIDDQTTDASLFHRLGGDPAIAAFVARFYDIMAADPQLERIWAWHPKDMAGLKARLGDFLSGFLGGPTLTRSATARR